MTPLSFHKKLVPKGGKGTLGTFAGVFTPSILTILGIILFLRLGYVVGSAGLGRALMIIGLANAISVLTSVSLSAIATNLKVKGGGDYYLISRTLGVEFGGAIGIVLFLAQSVSVAFYCIGFGEAVCDMVPGIPLATPQVVAVIAVLFLFVFAWLGADWATRFQYVVMSLLAAALVSFFVGGLKHWDAAVLARNWASPPGGSGFWILFAIFFPAVTGFTQGVSMSGDLKDPGKSLPLGTFSAVGLSILVYFSVAIVFAGVMPNDVLMQDYGAMKQAASVGFLIAAGVIGATLSSAMASFLGAPRILQSMATDRIFRFLLPFAQGVGPTNNPRRGVLLSAAIALATIGLGKLNVIAPVVSMFFLISYGLLNYATFYEARTESPSFRPRFRWFDRRLSLLGFIVCLGAMLAIDVKSGAVGIAVLFAIYHYLKHSAGPARWADSTRSYHFQHLREHLLAAAAEPEHPRDWRPQLLAFSDDSHRRGQLLAFASWIEGGSGLTTAVRVLEGEGVKMLKLREEAEEELRNDLALHGSKAFPLVIVAPNLQIGIRTLVQSYGVGPLKANTVLLNWFENLPEGILGLKEHRYSRNLRVAFRLGSNIIIFYAQEEAWKALDTLSPEDHRIDVWWWGDATSRLMLLLAYLMKRNETWHKATIRLFAGAHDSEHEETPASIEKMLEDVRIEAKAEVVPNINADVIAQRSADATLVFLPFRLKGSQIMGCPGDPLANTLSRLPMVASVLAAQDIDLDAEPEEGKAAEVASALDALANAKKNAKDAEKQAAEAADRADEALHQMRDAVLSGADEEILKEVEAAAREAKEQAIKTARRAAKALVKADDAARTVEGLGVLPAEEPEEPDKSSNAKNPRV